MGKYIKKVNKIDNYPLKAQLTKKIGAEKLVGGDNGNNGILYIISPAPFISKS